MLYVILGNLVLVILGISGEKILRNCRTPKMSEHEKNKLFIKINEKE